jgi:type IV pilus assembly protein PilE
MPPHSSRRAARSPRRGFTLIELMIALVLLGILAAIALPAYFEQLAHARRVDLQAALLEDAGYMQRYYAAHDAFTGVPPPQLPVENSPPSGAPGYAITVSVPADDPSSFVLTARRAGAMDHDACGDFTYDNLGRRDLVAGTFASGRSSAACWR